MTWDTEVKRNWCWYLVVLAFAVGIYLCFSSSPAEKAPTAAVLREEKTEQITAPVKVYQAAVKQKLDLPKTVVHSETQHVIAATDLPASKRERTVSTVLDEATGEAVQYVQDKPLPLVATENSGEAGAYLGFKNLEPAVRVEVKQNVFAVKALTLGVTASADVTQSGKTDTFVGVGGRFEW